MNDRELLTKMIQDSIFSLDEGNDNDVVNSPNHYKLRNGKEAIDIIRDILTEEELKGYYKGNIIKYFIRDPHKNGVEDREKLAVYLRWLESDLKKAKR